VRKPPLKVVDVGVVASKVCEADLDLVATVLKQQPCSGR
jgi:hypothetical protein